MRTLSCICFLALAVVLISSSPALAGAGPEPPDNATILPDEVWGVVVLICTTSPDIPDFAVVRVKQIQDCNVVVEVNADPAWAGGCPVLGGPITPEETIKDWALVGYSFFGIAGTPYIDSVKNFEQITDAQGNIETTFDAKFKFYQ